MSSERIERMQEVINEDNALVLSNYPVNWAGAALHMRNGNSNDVIVYVDESDDGTIWTVRTFSTPAASGQTSITLVEEGFGCILFTSTSKYLRIRVAAAEGDTTLNGVFVHMTQWPPKGLVPSEYA